MFSGDLVEELWALGSVILIDIVLAGDNAVAVGLAAAGLPKEQRGKVILLGIIAATVLRIIFALFITQLLKYGGGWLVLFGGVLLLWVAWKLWRELRDSRHAEEQVAEAALEGKDVKTPPKTIRQAAMQIVAADVSMSLDNVLAVAGVARDHIGILIIGLALSVALMGLAASIIARLLEKHRWIAYVGLALIAYVALKMIWDGAEKVMPHLGL
jgi:YjbE family integral membrane protein